MRKISIKILDWNNKRILIFKKNMSDKFWDQHWLQILYEKNKIKYSFTPKSLVSKVTKMFLNPKDGPILEGGCGIGNHIYTLSKMNYNIFGIDNSPATIRVLKKNAPFLNVELGDVRELPFPANHFIGYWSIGVIEHYYNGYLEIAKEMYRVIKPKGYLFLTFPFMSQIRALKTKLHLYRFFENELSSSKMITENFYQYILNDFNVIEDFKKLGFELIYKTPQGGIKGLKDENLFLKFFVNRFLNLLYHVKRPKLIRKMKRGLDKILEKFSAHMVLLVFQKT